MAGFFKFRKRTPYNLKRLKFSDLLDSISLLLQTTINSGKRLSLQFTSFCGRQHQEANVCYQKNGNKFWNLFRLGGGNFAPCQTFSNK